VPLTDRATHDALQASPQTPQFEAVVTDVGAPPQQRCVEEIT